MKRFSLLLMPLVLFFLLQCSDNPVDQDKGKPITPIDTTGNDLAAKWFQAIAETLGALDDKDTQGIRSTSLLQIRNGFNRALSYNSKNSTAHVGLSILEILELNYSEDVWEVIDSLEAWGGGSGSGMFLRAGARPGNAIIGRQFALLAEMPLNLAMRTVGNFPPNVTVAHIQDIIKNTIMPALGRSINHLATVEQNTKAKVTVTLEGEDFTETYIIDLGEIYFFDASVHALRSAFGFAIAYDYDLVGPDGTYGWIDDLFDLEQGGSDCARYALTVGEGGGDTLAIYDRCGSATVDSLMIAVLHHNLAHRSGFLALRQSGAVLSAAGQDLNGMIDKLEASVNFIKNVRTGETEQNVIKLSNLTDLQSDLGKPDAPNFAKDFHTIEDVLDWARDFASGEMLFSEQLGPSHQTFSWKMNVHALVSNPVQDWKTLLPYYRWVLPAGPWIERRLELQWEESWAGGYYAYVFEGGVCQYKYFSPIAYVREYCLYESMNMNVIEFLDELGNPIDMEVERMPYFPDYTLHGVFPDMNSRARWLELLDIMNPSP